MTAYLTLGILRVCHLTQPTSPNESNRKQSTELTDRKKSHTKHNRPESLQHIKIHVKEQQPPFIMTKSASIPTTTPKNNSGNAMKSVKIAPKAIVILSLALEDLPTKRSTVSGSPPKKTMLPRNTSFTPTRSFSPTAEPSPSICTLTSPHSGWIM